MLLIWNGDLDNLHNATDWSQHLIVMQQRLHLACFCCWYCDAGLQYVMNILEFAKPLVCKFANQSVQRWFRFVVVERSERVLTATTALWRRCAWRMICDASLCASRVYRTEKQLQCKFRSLLTTVYSRSLQTFIQGHRSHYTTVRGPDILRTTWLFRDMLHSTKSTNFSYKYYFFIIDKISSRAGWNAFASRTWSARAVVWRPPWSISITDSLWSPCLRIAVIFILASVWFWTVKWSEQKVLTGGNN